MSLLPVYGCTALTAHQANDVFALWHAWEDECGRECDVPYWAVVWPGAVSLAAYILSRPETVRNMNVLDFGCGCGIAGIAAAKAGALKVIANDIDPAALHIARLNSQANNVTMHFNSENLLIKDIPESYDIILVADMFYNRKQSIPTINLLRKHKARGTRILIADAERPFTPRQNMQIFKEEIVPVNFDLEGVKERRVTIGTLNV